jgi:hypothetical protein
MFEKLTMFQKLKALLGANIQVEVHRAQGTEQPFKIHHMDTSIDFSSSSEDRKELMAELKRAIHDAGPDPAAQKAAVDDFVALHGLTLQSFEAD